jgi:hypothetical protein
VSTTKEDLRRLVDELPNSELDAARRFLEYLRDTDDPLLKKLLEAPEEDEELADKAVVALAEAEEDFKAGRVITNEKIKREFGL